MKVHVVWHNDNPVHGMEWFFLMFGLATLNIFLWANTSTLLFQNYSDWAFDQKLRRLSPSVADFVMDQVRTLFTREQPKPKIVVAPMPAPKAEAFPMRQPAPSELIGRLAIPRLQLTAMVLEGADSRILRRAVGHIPGTALPGYAGNVAIAGHRDTFFRDLRNIQATDTIQLQTEHANYLYVVESTRIVSPEDIGVLAASDKNTLTLVTCYPFYYVGSAPKRFVVRAAFLSSAALGHRTTD